jgi:hypothetical protein
MANNETIAEREEAMVSIAELATEKLYQVVNGSDVTDVITESGPVPTLAKQAVQAQAKVTASLEEVASQMAGALTYGTIALGLAGTSPGGFFSVPSPESSEFLIMYRNDPGGATEVKRYPSTVAITKLSARLPRRLPRGMSGTTLALTLGNQLLAYLDRDGVFHSKHEHQEYVKQAALTDQLKPKKRPRSQGYSQPFVVVSGSSVVMAADLNSSLFGQQIAALQSDLASLYATKKRPRSQNYKQPLVIVAGGSVVLASKADEGFLEQQVEALTESVSQVAADTVELSARLDLVAASQPTAGATEVPQWLAREVTVAGEQQIMVHDGATYRQLTSAGANWLSPVVIAGNIVRCLREAVGAIKPYSILPSGFKFHEGKVLLQKIITGQSLSLGSRGYIINQNGAYAFEPGVNGSIDGVPGIGDLFTTSIPEDMRDYCLSLQGGPRPNMALTPAFIPIREYPNGVLGETISSSWALALRRWAVRATRTDLRLLATVHGSGGVPYANLKKGTSTYAGAITATQNAHTLAVANGWEHIVHSISIIHGESQLATSAAAYAGYLAEWVSDYSADVMAITGQTIAPKGFLSQMSTIYSATQEIPLGQLLAHETNQQLCLVGPKYQFPYWDSSHSIAEGYVKIGEIEARAERFALLGAKWQPLRPLAVSLAGTTLTVTFNNNPDGAPSTAGPVGALVLDDHTVINPGNYGFALTDPAVSITSVALAADGHSVVLALSAAPVAGTQLEYAMQLTAGSKPSGGPRGCLRDADTRDRSRFDDSYLYNWCVSFRKTIEGI